MTTIIPGMTCNRGKGKTLWEVIEVNEQTHTVELSALGKGGYTNKHTTIDELTNILPQQIITPLHLLLSARTEAKAKAARLEYALRFTNADRIQAAAEAALGTAQDFAAYCRSHAEGLVALGIVES